jgi:hypothetical protein
MNADPPPPAKPEKQAKKEPGPTKLVTVNTKESEYCADAEAEAPKDPLA